MKGYSGLNDGALFRAQTFRTLSSNGTGARGLRSERGHGKSHFVRDQSKFPTFFRDNVNILHTDKHKISNDSYVFYFQDKIMYSISQSHKVINTEDQNGLHTGSEEVLEDGEDVESLLGEGLRSLMSEPPSDETDGDVARTRLCGGLRRDGWLCSCS